MSLLRYITACLIMLSSPSIALEISDIGAYTFFSKHYSDNNKNADGLSGFTRIAKNKYLAVSDRHAQIHQLSIEIDSSSGAIKQASSQAFLTLVDNATPTTEGPDREAIIYQAEKNRLCVANERTGTNLFLPSISCHDLKSGKQKLFITPNTDKALNVFKHINRNKGFESLAKDATTNTIWTANEYALKIDNASDSVTQPSSVRLQQFDADFKPLKQYRYDVDAIGEAITNVAGSAKVRVNGLVELLFLPTGQLLSLERAFVGDKNLQARMRMRIYLVDFSMTSVTKTNKVMTDKDMTNNSAQIKNNKVNKTLLFELLAEPNFTTANFEGMALSEQLNDGSYTLMLLADNNTGAKQTLHALKLTL